MATRSNWLAALPVALLWSQLASCGGDDVTDDDCPAARPTCGPSHICSAACTDDDSCPGILVCDTSVALCAECATNADCGLDEVCQVDHTCG